MSAEPNAVRNFDGVRGLSVIQEVIQKQFEGQPEKFKKFLEILKTFQRNGRKSTGIDETQEVHSRIKKLLEDHSELFQEFGLGLGDLLPVVAQGDADAVNQQNTQSKGRIDLGRQGTNAMAKRPAAETAPYPKKLKLQTVSVSGIQNDLALSKVGRFGALKDFAFFDMVKRTLKSPEVYDNFLRCISLYTDESLSKYELLQSVTPFLVGNPELQARFKDLIGLKDSNSSFPVTKNLIRSSKLSQKLISDIDFAISQNSSGSYCALPDDYEHPLCSGRTPLCNEVLNDVWVTCPSWTEDSKFKITNSEEYIYRCEDERSELDAALQANSDTIQALNSVMTKMSRMTPERQSLFRLDECLGGVSSVLQQRTIRRVYKEKGEEMLERLKTTPSLTVPIVIEYIKSKNEEWRKFWLDFDIIWREQMETFYLKSLDPMGLSFRQSDLKALRSRSLLNEIQTFYVERQEYNSTHPEEFIVGPHLSLLYKNMTILDDATNLLLHQIRRQANILKVDKRKMKLLLKYFIADLFHHPRMELSDDDTSDDDKELDVKVETKQKEIMKLDTVASVENSSAEKTNNSDDKSGRNRFKTAAERKSFENEFPIQSENEDEIRVLGSSIDSGDRLVSFKEEVPQLEFEKTHLRVITLPHPDEDEVYNLFFANNGWYVFLRTHQILCERLTKMHDTAVKICMEEAKENPGGISTEESYAFRSGFKKRRDVEPENYYSKFLGMVRDLLDGSIDSNCFENSIREMFTINAYIAYTIDRVIVSAVRQLHSLVTDNVCRETYMLHEHAKRSGGAGGIYASMNTKSRILAETFYRKSTERICQAQNQNCVKVIIYRKESRMTMELILPESETPSPSDSIETEQRAKYSAYLESFSGGDNASDVQAEQWRYKIGSKPVFLQRNIRRWNQNRLEFTNIQSRISNSSLPDLEVASMDFVDDGSEVNGNHSYSGNIDSQELSVSKDLMYWDRGEGFTEIGSSSVSDRSEESLDRKSTRLAQLVIEENLQCQFDPRTFRITFVAHTEDFMYLNGSLKKARENNHKVSLKLYTRFYDWHKEWLRRNVTFEQIYAWERLVLSRNKKRRTSKYDSPTHSF